MSTSDHDDDTTETDTPDFTIVDTPEETPENDDTTYIVHRYVRADGNTTELRMPTSEWAAYAKENDL